MLIMASLPRPGRYSRTARYILTETTTARLPSGCRHARTFPVITIAAVVEFANATFVWVVIPAWVWWDECVNISWAVQAIAQAIAPKVWAEISPRETSLRRLQLY
jgi:hypothetical protein